MTDKDTIERAMELRLMTNTWLKRLTPYERECMRRVHFAEAKKEPIDPVAKKVVEDSVDRFNAEWRRKREERKGQSGRTDNQHLGNAATGQGEP